MHRMDMVTNFLKRLPCQSNMLHALFHGLTSAVCMVVLLSSSLTPLLHWAGATQVCDEPEHLLQWPSKYHQHRQKLSLSGPHEGEEPGTRDHTAF